MRDEYYIGITLAGLFLASSLMWLARPTAIPAHPDDIFPRQVVQAPAKPSPAKAARAEPSAQEAMAAPEPERLDLTRYPETPEIPLDNDNSLAFNEATPSAVFDLTPASAKPRPEVPKIKLFDEGTGTRGFSARRWLSSRMGVEAGIGLTEGESLRERQAAAGIGFVLGFD